MNEPHDPLEAELADLRPHEPSPGLRQRIAGRLRPPVPSRPRWAWRVVVAGGLAAACLAAAVLLGRGKDRGEPIVRPRPPHPEPPGERDDTAPTLKAYAHALARSPEELDALLDKHAAHAPERNRQPVAVRAFTWSDADLRTLTGEP